MKNISRVLENSTNLITQNYNNQKHKGIDLISRETKTCNILAHSDGVVVWLAKNKDQDRTATGNESYGNAVKIKHNNGYYTLYAHLNNVLVNYNDVIKQGTVLGYMGKTGNAKGNHLHFELRNQKDIRIDPTAYINNDLPSTNVKYQTFDTKKNKWLPNVLTNTNSYAGNFNNPVGALYIDNLKYRVHDLKKNKWLPFVEGRKDYAGNKQEIDGVQIYNAIYRVHIKNSSWLPWVNKVDNTNNGYAGIYGKIIDAIEIKINK